MKYMQNGGFQGHPLMRLTLYWTLLFMAGLWVSNAAMYLTRMGLTPASVEAYYRGSEADYSSPKSARALLEVSHAHLPVMGVVILLLTHLLIFAPYSDGIKKTAISAVFSAAILGEASGWLVRFVHPGFAWLKILCFLLFQTALALLIAGLGLFLLQGARQRRIHRARP